MEKTELARRSRFGAVAIVLAFSVACGSDGPADRAATTGGESGSGKGTEVDMRLIAFKPDAVKVKPGTTVNWSQQDAGFHTVTSGTTKVDPSGSIETQPDERFASGKLAKGKTFSFTFDDAGTYSYFCEIHPATMRGEIEVT